ncbi:MAG: hypothetical protein R3284_03425 [Rubricoccaceae bacterium]|nr:hypothetical protein [Rubricoccaceae bacterium]
MESVPFKVKEVDGGFSEAHGSAYVQGEDLVLDIEKAFLGHFMRKSKVYRIELTDLDTVRYKKGIRKDRVDIRTRPLDRLAKVPGVTEGTLSIVVSKKNREQLEVLLDRLDLWRAD